MLISSQFGGRSPVVPRISERSRNRNGGREIVAVPRRIVLAWSPPCTRTGTHCGASIIIWRLKKPVKPYLPFTPRSSCANSRL